MRGLVVVTIVGFLLGCGNKPDKVPVSQESKGEGAMYQKTYKQILID